MGTLNFRPLSLAFNCAVHTLCKAVWPQGFDVSATAPDTFEKLMAEYATRGRITVWNGASETTVFDDPGTNHMFRAWHDFCHIAGPFPFTLEGEADAARMQCGHVLKRYGRGPTATEICTMIRIEVNGQAHFEARHGHFPANQKAFARAYLANPMAAMEGRFEGSHVNG